MSDDRKALSLPFEEPVAAPSPSPLHTEVDIELAEVEASADRAENDEPEREPYATRLQSLHDAVVALDGETTS